MAVYQNIKMEMTEMIVLVYQMVIAGKVNVAAYLLITQVMIVLIVMA